MNWKNISAAPRDGTEIRFNHGCIGIKVAKYSNGWLFKCPIRGVFVESGFGLELDEYNCKGWTHV